MVTVLSVRVLEVAQQRGPRSVATRDAEVLALDVRALDVLGNVHWNAATASASIALTSGNPERLRARWISRRLIATATRASSCNATSSSARRLWHAKKKLTSLPPTMAEGVAVEL